MEDNNFFKLFGLQQEFELNIEDLTSRYRALQSKIHPDKFANASEKERALSVQKAALVNDAYQTLKSPLRRAKYMLYLCDINLDSAQNAAPMSASFLMEQMELRESLTEIQKSTNPNDRLKDIFEHINNKEQALISSISIKLTNASKENIEEAANNVRQLQFFLKLQEEAEHIESELNL